MVFTTPMPNDAYSVSTAVAGYTYGVARPTNKSATGFTMRTVYNNAGGVTPSDYPFDFAVNATNAVLPDSFSEEQIQSVVDLAKSGVTNPGASAWSQVEADGTLIGGLNFSSVTRTSAGVYDYVFQTPMPDANYSVVVQHSGVGNTSINGLIRVKDRTATGFTVLSSNPAATTILDSPHATTVFATNALPPRGGTGTDCWGSCEADGSINASFNVASVTRTAAGKYDVVFTTPMPTANYAVTTGSTSSSAAQSRTIDILSKTTTGFTARPKNGVNYQDYDFDFTVNATNATLPTTFTEEQIQSVLDFIAVANPAGVAKAWGSCADDGTIEASFNVASVTRTATGKYDVVFTTPMPTANYAVTATPSDSGTTIAYIENVTANGFEIITVGSASGAGRDSAISFTVNSN